MGVDCTFCRIVAGQAPAAVVHETDHTVAFRDINPQAPIHVLVVSREHYRDAASLAHADAALAGELLRAAGEVAKAEGVTDYRLVFNTGPGAGQSVYHVHCHVLAGRPLTWPPG